VLTGAGRGVERQRCRMPPGRLDGNHVVGPPRRTYNVISIEAAGRHSAALTLHAAAGAGQHQSSELAVEAGAGGDGRRATAAEEAIPEAAMISSIVGRGDLRAAARPAGYLLQASPFGAVGELQSVGR